jgi:hypothetical protein
MREKLLIAGLALLTCGCAARERNVLGVGPSKQLRVGAEVGSTTIRWIDIEDGDEWDATVYRVFGNVGSFDEGMNWEFNARAELAPHKTELDDTPDEVEATHDGFDLRYRIGWGWKRGKGTRLSLLTGPRYRRTAIKFDPNFLTDRFDYEFYMITWNIGGRIQQDVGERIAVIGEGYMEYPITGRPELTDTADDDINTVQDGYVFGARGGVEFRMSKKIRLGGGVLYELEHYRYGGNWKAKDEFETTAAYFNLVVDF